ncbi:MAG TPA: hypothetical protein VJA64_08495 [Desulfobaccales bacterium]|nr:hypothetical protein [Desulfobaccales bacterium]
MNRLFDLLLAKPLAEGWLQVLLFFAFTLHLLFVLITLGTAILAVVLGVAPLMLIQVAFATSFFTATNLLAPYWMFFIGLLIIAFLSFDILGHAIEPHRRYHLAIALVTLPALLLVPGDPRPGPESP